MADAPAESKAETAVHLIHIRRCQEASVAVDVGEISAAVRMMPPDRDGADGYVTLIGGRRILTADITRVLRQLAAVKRRLGAQAQAKTRGV